MQKLTGFHQICYGCQVPLKAQIRVIAEMIKLPNGYSNKIQRNNSVHQNESDDKVITKQKLNLACLRLTQIEYRLVTN